MKTMTHGVWIKMLILALMPKILKVQVLNNLKANKPKLSNNLRKTKRNKTKRIAMSKRAMKRNQITREVTHISKIQSQSTLAFRNQNLLIVVEGRRCHPSMQVERAHPLVTTQILVRSTKSNKNKKVESQVILISCKLTLASPPRKSIRAER